MKHDFIDKYSHLESPLHLLDPRTKFILLFSLIVLVVSTPNPRVFLFYLPTLAVLMALSRVPLSFYLKRLLLIAPFVLLVAIFLALSSLVDPTVNEAPGGFLSHPLSKRLLLLVLKTGCAVLFLTLLTSVTRFTDLLWAFRRLRFPAVVTTLSKLVYTYIFLLIDELHRTLRALRSRAPELKLSRTKTYGNLAAVILLRSINRSETVYQAMVSRGFRGEFPEGNGNRFKRNDGLALLVFLSFTLFILLVWKI